jgi:hypothetical protein
MSAAALAKRRRQQSLGWDLHERWVGVISVSICICQLHRFGYGVEVVRASVSRLMEVKVLENIQCLWEHRTLTAESVFVNRVDAM